MRKKKLICRFVIEEIAQNYFLYGNQSNKRTFKPIRSSETLQLAT